MTKPITVYGNPHDTYSGQWDGYSTVVTAPLANGGFLAAGETMGTSIYPGQNGVVVYRFDASGAPIDTIQVSSVAAFDENVQVVALGSGQLLVAWESEATDGNVSILGRVLNPDGTPLGSEFAIASNVLKVGSVHMLLDPLPSGGARISWQVPTYLGSTYEILTYEQGVDSNGALAGGAIDLGANIDRSVANLNGSAALGGRLLDISGGRVLRYWQALGTDGNSHVYYEILGQTEPVQVDAGDYLVDSSGESKYSAYPVQLSDGRVLFAYQYGGQGVVSGEKLVILSAADLGLPATLSDGAIAGATVFADANANGVLDPGESSATTDARGQVTLSGGDRLVATGGVDIATNLPLPIRLTAPAGSSVITPLTTLIDAVGGTNTLQRVATALGLDPATDLVTLDPIAGTLAAMPGAAAALIAGAKVMNLLVAGAADVRGMTGVAEQSAADTVLGALVTAVNAGGVVDLADAATVAGLLNAALSGANPDAGAIAAVAAAIAAANAAVDAAAGLSGVDLLTAVSAVELTAQGDLAGALLAAGGDTAALQSVSTAYTGSNLNAAIAANVPRLGDVAPCFAAGTRLRTPDGETPVDSLACGDWIMTVDGTAKPIRWIGHRRVDCQRHPHPAAVQPIRIQAHAFGEGQPARDLLLSPDHAVFLADALIPIKHLQNGSTVRQVPMQSITYYHIELAEHDVVLAEGLAAETFLDTGNRAAFANGGIVTQLHPEFHRQDDIFLLRESLAYRPLAVCGGAVDHARALLRGSRAERITACPAQSAVAAKISQPVPQAEARIR